MPPHRYRIFTHEGNAASRKPFGATSEAELNSQHQQQQQQQQQPKVKKLINKHSWGFKPRAASSPNLTTYGQRHQQQQQETSISPEPVQDAKVMNRPNTSHKPSVIIPSRLQLASDRSVQFRGIPASVGLSSIVAQSSGGPLERIETKPEGGGGTYTVELHFLHPANSTSFFNYASTGRFIVNGQPYLPYRNHSHYNIKSRSVLEEMLYRGARRCVTLKMLNSAEYLKSANKKNGYNVSLNLTLEWIKKHFEKLGQIVSIQPMITTTVTICIQYADVRSAIRAKSFFDKRDDDWAKLYSRWTLKYGKDPVDKTCPASFAR
ncbi:hypothetical protein TRICI_006371 [Trichomonascus ciferrii]|uniref:RRM domain-containing protein n=1 Tax=Trichomonascus ciferrii TaxID=44093 RepID=A0A642UPB4_9ASCO|nr:hypothetical protein TRICI_006371 [Trichomonascus ciferrii]